MYFLIKSGVYIQGVFWIGNDLEEGKTWTDYYADTDKDSYHTWELYLYTPSAQYNNMNGLEAPHEEVYSRKHGDKNAKNNASN